MAHSGSQARVLRTERGKMDVDTLTIQPAGEKAAAHDRMQITKIAAMDHHSEVLP
jgi:hypothetical protein